MALHWGNTLSDLIQTLMALTDFRAVNSAIGGDKIQASRERDTWLIKTDNLGVQT